MKSISEYLEEHFDRDFVAEVNLQYELARITGAAMIITESSRMIEEMLSQQRKVGETESANVDKGTEFMESLQQIEKCLGKPVKDMLDSPIWAKVSGDGRYVSMRFLGITKDDRGCLQCCVRVLSNCEVLLIHPSLIRLEM